MRLAGWMAATAAISAIAVACGTSSGPSGQARLRVIPSVRREPRCAHASARFCVHPLSRPATVVGVWRPVVPPVPVSEEVLARFPSLRPESDPHEWPDMSIAFDGCSVSQGPNLHEARLSHGLSHDHVAWELHAEGPRSTEVFIYPAFFESPTTFSYRDSLGAIRLEHDPTNDRLRSDAPWDGGVEYRRVNPTELEPAELALLENCQVQRLLGVPRWLEQAGEGVLARRGLAWSEGTAPSQRDRAFVGALAVRLHNEAALGFPTAVGDEVLATALRSPVASLRVGFAGRLGEPSVLWAVENADYAMLLARSVCQRAREGRHDTSDQTPDCHYLGSVPFEAAVDGFPRTP